MRWMQALKWNKKTTGGGAIAAADVTESATPAAEDAKPQAAFGGPAPSRGWVTGAKWAAGAVLLVGLLAGWGLAEQRLGRYVTGTQTQVLSPRDVQLADAPAWMPDWLKTELTTLVAVQAGADPQDEQGLERALWALKANPWVARVERVDRAPTPGGVVRVFAQYRKPAAWVRGDDGYRIVDVEGVHLPFHSELSRVRLPVIEPPVGVAARPPKPGERWPGTQVQAGLALIAAVADYPFANQVAAYGVDVVSPHGQRIGLVLWTGSGRDADQDPHVEWGRMPGHEEAIEPSATAKLEWLTLINQTYRAIDAGHKIVDVRGPAATWREPGPTPVPGPGATPSVGMTGESQNRQAGLENAAAPNRPTPRADAAVRNSGARITGYTSRR